MNQDEQEGQSMGRTTGATGEDAEQQLNRTIEGQESDPGDYTGQGSSADGNAGGGDAGGGNVGGGTGGESSGGNPQGSYSGQGNTNVGGSDSDFGSDIGGQSGMGGAASGSAGSDVSGQGGLGGALGVGAGGDDGSDQVNEQMDESQWQGSRFSEGGSQGNNPGGSNS